MTTASATPHPASATEWSAAELGRRLDAGTPFFVFDVRNEDEYEAFRLEGRGELPMANVPYYEMLESDEHDDVVDSFIDFLERGWTAKLPKEMPILAVCAKGDTSEYVAEALRRVGFEAANLSGGTAAWGDYYLTRAVVESPELSIWQIARPARGCLSYLVASGGKAVVIDALRHTDHYLELLEARDLELVLVLDTHAHADHISGGPALAAKHGVPYHLHPYDAIHPIDVLPATIDYDYIADGTSFSVGDAEIRTLHIPGHTLGNVAYLVDDRFLLTGDSIFLESIARPDLGGQSETWTPLHYRSLRRLLELPDETVVLPAHFNRLSETGEGKPYAAPLGKLAERNKGLVMAQRPEEEFVAYILQSLPEFPEEYIEIKRVNAGLAEAGESKASELELGKNVCALASAADG